MLGAEFGTGQVFLSMMWFFLFFIWVWLLVSVFGDIFRSRDLSGWSKAIWTFFVIVLPYLGVFAYLIARGNTMNERAMESAQARYSTYNPYPPTYAPAAPSSVDQLSKLTDLRNQGVIDEVEYERMKVKVTA